MDELQSGNSTNLVNMFTAENARELSNRKLKKHYEQIYKSNPLALHVIGKIKRAKKVRQVTIEVAVTPQSIQEIEDFVNLMDYLGYAVWPLVSDLRDKRERIYTDDAIIELTDIKVSW